MAKLVDPDSLNRGTEIVFDTGLKTIQLVVAGTLDDNAPGRTSGVTAQAVYSKCKELWRTESDLRPLRFPFDPITEVKFDLFNGWDWADQQTKDLIRDGGWSLRDAGGVATELYMGIITLGDFDNSLSDLAYYHQTAGFGDASPTSSFDKTGEVNEPVQISGSTGEFTSFYRILLREQGKLYDESDLLTDQDIASLDYTVYRIPLGNTTDPKVTTTDGDIDTLAPYTGMSVDYLTGSLFETYTSGTNYVSGDVVLDSGRWYRATDAHNAPLARTDSASVWQSYPGERQIGTNWFAYNRIIEGNNGTLEQIYEWGQRQLRSSDDINDNTIVDDFGVVSGTLASPLFDFVGDTLQTQGGVYIDNFDTNDTNRIQLFDITVDGGGLDSTFFTPLTTTQRTFPFVAAGTLVFNDELVNDADAEYYMYFTNDDAGDNAGNDYDTPTAILVEDNSGFTISGSITTSEIAFDYDYDNNVQRGTGSDNTDAPVSVVAIGLSGSQWIVGEFTITRATGLRFPVNAAIERVYRNE